MVHFVVEERSRGLPQYVLWFLSGVVLSFFVLRSWFCLSCKRLLIWPILYMDFKRKKKLPLVSKHLVSNSKTLLRYEHLFPLIQQTLFAVRASGLETGGQRVVIPGEALSSSPWPGYLTLDRLIHIPGVELGYIRCVRHGDQGFLSNSPMSVESVWGRRSQ